MKIIRIEILKNKEPVSLSTPWLPAWEAPGGKPLEEFNLKVYRIISDEGLVGIGPFTGNTEPEILNSFSQYKIGKFFSENMSGKRMGFYNKNASGLEIALWDLLGKETNQSVYRLLGGNKKSILVYAATSRLLEPEAHVEQIVKIMKKGFKAVKLRLHRLNPEDDLNVIKTVRKKIGNQIKILVDANQNNPSKGYIYWSRRTAYRMAEELNALDVYFIEEPLPRKDIDGLSRISSSVEMFVAGGEHSHTIYDFKKHITEDAYDIIQPDVIMGGNMGITGLRRAAIFADFYDKLIIPHVCSNCSFPIGFAATLQAMLSIDNCPMIEFPYDPPILTESTIQHFVQDSFEIDKEGFITVPDKPGIGIDLREELFEVEKSISLGVS